MPPKSYIIFYNTAKSFVLFCIYVEFPPYPIEIRVQLLGFLGVLFVNLMCRDICCRLLAYSVREPLNASYLTVYPIFSGFGISGLSFIKTYYKKSSNLRTLLNSLFTLKSAYVETIYLENIKYCDFCNMWSIANDL